MSDQQLKAMLIRCIEADDFISATRLLKILAAPQQAEIIAKLKKAADRETPIHLA